MQQIFFLSAVFEYVTLKYNGCDMYVDFAQERISAHASQVDWSHELYQYSLTECFTNFNCAMQNISYVLLFLQSMDSNDSRTGFKGSQCEIGMYTLLLYYLFFGAYSNW
jgi:hypothetical protein